MPRASSHAVPSPFRCLTCNKTYSTSSHLRRHEATHTGRVSCTCPFCNRTFSRLDVARRHLRSCAPIEGAGVALPGTKRGKRRQACDRCARSKLSCDLKTPCFRCCARGATCSYLNAQNGPADTGLSNEAGSGTYNPWRIPVDFLLAFTDPDAADTSEVVVKDSSNQCNHQDTGDNANLESDLQNGVPMPNNPWSHGDCLLDFFEFEIEMRRKSLPDPQPQPDLPGEPRGLKARMQEAIAQLSKAYASMSCNGTSDKIEFDWLLAESVFTVDNLRDFVWAYFHCIHRHNSVIHRPTFDCEKVSLPLLLAVFLFGSVYSAPLDSALSARYFFACAEEYIYTHPTFKSLVEDLPTERGTTDEIQVLQAAVTIQTLQYGVNNKTTRRRIRVERHPHLVTAVRSAGFFQAKHSGPSTTWEEFIKTETLVRIAIWTFLGDGFQATFYNSPPMIALSELFGSLPCPEYLFEADSASEFQQLVSSLPQGSDPQLPSEFVSFLFRDTWPGPKHEMYRRLTADHLLVIVMALVSVTVNARTICLTHAASGSIIRAADRWKKLWDSVVEQEPEQQCRHGFAKHAPEVFWLTRTILHVAQSGDKSHGYMRGIVTDTLHEVHGFIQKYQGFEF